MLEQVFGGQAQEPNSRAEKIIELTERLQRIESAASRIKYDNDLVLEIPEVLKTLGAAKDAVIAELKAL